MSGIAESGLQRSEGCLNSTIVKIVASLLMLGVVTGGGALADQRLESFDEMVPQRPGMKTEEDYQRFVQEHGLPQRSELTPEDMDRLRLAVAKTTQTRGGVLPPQLIERIADVR